MKRKNWSFSGWMLFFALPLWGGMAWWVHRLMFSGLALTGMQVCSLGLVFAWVWFWNARLQLEDLRQALRSRHRVPPARSSDLAPQNTVCSYPAQGRAHASHH